MQGRRKLDVTFTKQRLEEDYSELKSVIRMADKYKVSKKTILNYMTKFGIDRHRRVVEFDELVKLASEDYSIKEIADILNFSDTAIRNAANKFGIRIEDKYHKGYVVNYAGYISVLCKDHPYADSKGYVKKHRLIMEEIVGRYLCPSEVVHHVNRDVSDNRPQNLQLMTNGEHISLHHTGKVGRGSDKAPRKNKKK